VSSLERFEPDGSAAAPAMGIPDGVPAALSADHRSLSPQVLSYVVGPVALVVLVIFRHLGVVAQVPLWAYVAAIAGAAVCSMAVEQWHSEPIWSYKFQIRLAIHVLSVTAVIYMTGWGPVLGMAYAFVALEEIQMQGAGLWRTVMGWSLFNIVVAQYLVWLGSLPSFLERNDTQVIGALGAFVLVIVVRMAGATGEKKERAEGLLAHQALHDMLTGLPNRLYFYDRTDDFLGHATDSDGFCAVMLFDLDRFKEINDTLGHKYGDFVLTEVGPRVRSVLRADDTLARLGGDEFCVLLPSVSGQEDAVHIADRIISVLEDPFEVNGNILGIEASCGIAMAPASGGTADLLVQQADVAMYVAKGSQSHVVVYSEEMNVNTPVRLSLLAELRNAVARNEFVLHFQPKASMVTRQVQGVEALIRWRHPERGLLGPDEFIPEAERSGLIEPITHWVLDEALEQCRRWLDQAEGAPAPELSIAVNLSPRCLLDAFLPETVRAALVRWDVPPHLLELEITETIIMFDPERARRVLTDLAHMGVMLSIDDFGTGYSSLAYLKNLPVHQLKIDRSFVQEMGTGTDDEVIVRSVVDLARNLGLQTVAEGVEDEATWQHLTDLGCDSAQGYFLARPMTADLFTGWLHQYAETLARRAGISEHRTMMTRTGLTAVPH
jgi:diguanylate cyclase (GGDEF)-like protein